MRNFSFLLSAGEFAMAASGGGRRERMLVVYSNGANSAGHLAIHKVVLRYQ